MIDNEFQNVGLYNHNATSYKLVRAAYESGAKVVGIVHATGTGKSYNALELAYENKDKKIVYVVPSNGIIEHIKQIIDSNPNLDMERDFSNLEFRTYQSFISLNAKEMADIACDFLILDEFHHIGAPVWGARINSMIETHPDIKVFGMTAYTVRDRGSIYERDMANPDTDELFSRKIVSRYDLCDGMMDGVLPKPIYKSAYTSLKGIESKLEERVQKLDATTRDYQELMAILLDVKRRIHEAPSIPNILRKSIKPDGKYIYFCPPCSEEGTNDIETIKNQAMGWFKQFVKEKDIIFYTSTSEMGEDGRKNREAFYEDRSIEGENVEKKLRIMFAINQYNEGIHAPNVDGVIMGRGTTSDIVYFEQLGRALSVRGDTKEKFEELEKYSKEELIEICKSKDIVLKGNESKEEIIEKLIAPIVIDLTNNYEFIKELENNLGDRIKNVEAKGLGSHIDMKIRDASFDIEIENQDLYEMLRYISDRLIKTWEDMYEYAKIYYEHHGNLEVPQRFKTNDGFTQDENGIIHLGQWIRTQRSTVDPESEKGKALALIGMRFKNKYLSWEEMYEYTKIYYEHHGNLEAPFSFKTNDGFTRDENGIIHLGQWISNQRSTVDPESERGKALALMEMRFKNIRNTTPWEEMYEYAKIYYEHHGDLEAPFSFKTNDGFTRDENGIIHLGQWIRTQRSTVDPESERGKALALIGMRFKNKYLSWEEMYEYAKIYYEHHGDLEVPFNFKTNDGFTQDENGIIHLGQWIITQRKNVDPESERGKALTAIGMRFKNIRNTTPWEEMYEYAKIYYKHHGNLEVPQRFKTNDGFTQDENGIIHLGQWISNKRSTVDPESERGKALTAIEMVWPKKYKNEEIGALCREYNINFDKNKTVLKNISTTELESKIQFLIKNNTQYIDENGKLASIFSMSSQEIQENYGVTLEEIINGYNLKKQ